MNPQISWAKGLLALSPLFVFLMLYLVLSIVADDFYAVPIAVAFLTACLYSLTVMKGKSINERFATLTNGACKPDLMMMVWIFILAGTFAQTAEQMGAIDATVNLVFYVLPSNLIWCGLFLAACIISLSVGTSVGTIAAITPVACGIADQTGESLPLAVAIVVGGAYFGDNLSFISDTTIMATKTQGCEMRDKFRANIKIAMPAAIICMVLYTYMGIGETAAQQTGSFSIWLVAPYLYILIASVMGMNVLMVLTSGTILAGAIGLVLDKFGNIFDWFHAMSEGIMGMSELIIVTLLASGMVAVIREMGGITFIMQRLTDRIKGKRGAEISIASLVVLTNLCTANNTIAILTVGSLAREISTRFGIPARRSASILDTFSCFAQGIIPYGAQMLIASGLAKINPLDIIPYLYYPYILGGMALLNIITHHEKKIVTTTAADNAQRVYGEQDHRKQPE